MFRYSVADQVLDSSLRLPLLKSLQCNTVTGDDPSQLTMLFVDELSTASAAQPKFVIGFLHNRNRKITMYDDARGCLLDFADLGKVFFSKQADRQVLLALENPDVTDQTVMELLLGPGLIPLLTDCDIWTFHASAVAFDGKVDVFLADSGAGKSTLARELQQRNVDMERVSDDVLPVRNHSGILNALPRYPQLKLQNPCFWALYKPERLIIRSINILRTAKNYQVYHIEDTETMNQLIHHTVASRLFDRRRLERHFDFCYAVSRMENICYRIIDYPKIDASIDQVSELLYQ